LITLGFSTPITFGIAAARTRSLHFYLATAVYTTLIILGFELPNETIGFTCWDINWLVGAVHPLVVRSSVFPPPRTRPEAAIETAMNAAKERRELRRKARDIVAGDPGLARELGIGRPDLDRPFDDGGLIDVNAARPPSSPNSRGSPPNWPTASSASAKPAAPIGPSKTSASSPTSRRLSPTNWPTTSSSSPDRATKHRPAA
jgi:hypothetical protein